MWKTFGPFASKFYDKRESSLQLGKFEIGFEFDASGSVKSLTSATEMDNCYSKHWEIFVVFYYPLLLNGWNTVGWKCSHSAKVLKNQLENLNRMTRMIKQTTGLEVGGRRYWNSDHGMYMRFTSPPPSIKKGNQIRIERNFETALILCSSRAFLRQSKHTRIYETAHSLSPRNIQLIFPLLFNGLPIIK